MAAGKGPPEQASATSATSARQRPNGLVLGGVKVVNQALSASPAAAWPVSELPPSANDKASASDSCIRNLAFFKDCDQKFITEIAMHFAVEVYRPGQIIIGEGIECSSLWIVHHGSVEVSQKGKRSKCIEDGDSFGESQILAVKRVSTHEFRARTFVDVRVLQRCDLLQVLAHHAYECVLFQHMSLAQKIEHLNRTHVMRDEGLSEQHRRLLDEKRKLEQIISKGRQSRRGVRDSLMWTHASMNLEAFFNNDVQGGFFGVVDPRKPKHRTASPFVEERPLPGRQSLTDWHRQLAASPEGRKLNLWQLNSQNAAKNTLTSEEPALPATPSFGTYMPSGVGTPRPNRCPLLPDSSSADYSTNSIFVLQKRPYPQIPPSPVMDPASIRTHGRRSASSRDAGVNRNRPAVASRATTSMSDYSSCCVDVSQSSCLCQESRKRPHSCAVSKAIATLSRGLMRSQWHCENIAKAKSVSIGNAELPIAPWPEPRLESPSARKRGSSLSDVQRASPLLGGVSWQTQTSLPEETDSTWSDSPSQSTELAAASAPFCPPCRLEITLRGAFQNHNRIDTSDDDHIGDADLGSGTRAHSVIGNLQCYGTGQVGKHQSLDEDLRERMGFGKDECGVAPSGRSSVPAVHGSHGSLSAPPLPGATVDEGVDLAMLERYFEQQVRKILERSSRVPSRATSCEPGQGQDTRESSPYNISPPSSLTPSPRPRPREEELSLNLQVRLCQSRCGSSSAVLQLTFDHGPDCSEAAGCLCRFPPDDAGARLRTYFSRHTLLRLTPLQLPVRVFAEPLVYF